MKTAKALRGFVAALALAATGASAEMTVQKPVARDSGDWPSNNSVRFEIRYNGFSGTFHDTCSSFTRYHAQHVVRLPNKDGRAYFAVTQSNHDGSTDTSDGYFLVFRTDADAYDAENDRGAGARTQAA